MPIQKHLADPMLHSVSIDHQQLISDLSSAELSTRFRAVQALAEIEGVSVPLCQLLVVETEPVVQQILVSALIRFPTPEVVQHLVLHLPQASIALKNNIAEILRHYPPQLLNMAGIGLADPDPSLRLIWLQIMADWPNPPLLDVILECLTKEQDSNVFAAMVELAVPTGDQRLIPVFAAASPRFAKEPFVQFVLTQAMARLEQSYE